MQYLKGKTSHTLQMEYPHLRKRYWGRHLWARWYYCVSAGNVTEEMVGDYIEGHDQRPHDESFRIEGEDAPQGLQRAWSAGSSSRRLVDMRVKRCTSDARGSWIEEGPRHEAVARQVENMQQRGQIVELAFARATQHEGFRRWSGHGSANVRAQWTLLCTTLNLRKMHDKWAEGALTVA